MLLDSAHDEGQGGGEEKKEETRERIPRCSLVVVGGRSHADIVGHSSARANAVI